MGGGCLGFVRRVLRRLRRGGRLIPGRAGLGDGLIQDGGGGVLLRPGGGEGVPYLIGQGDAQPLNPLGQPRKDDGPRLGQGAGGGGFGGNVEQPLGGDQHPDGVPCPAPRNPEGGRDGQPFPFGGQLQLNLLRPIAAPQPQKQGPVRGVGPGETAGQTDGVDHAHYSFLFYAALTKGILPFIKGSTPPPGGQERLFPEGFCGAFPPFPSRDPSPRTGADAAPLPAEKAGRTFQGIITQKNSPSLKFC